MADNCYRPEAGNRERPVLGRSGIVDASQYSAVRRILIHHLVVSELLALANRGLAELALFSITSGVMSELKD